METVFITGCSRGIGLELTRQFLALDYQVIATYRNRPSTELATLNANPHLTIVDLEVTDSAGIDAVSAQFKDHTIDILINNAGVIGPDEQGHETIEADGWMHTLAVNTVAPLMVSQAFLRQLKRSANGRILTISSQMGALNRKSKGMYAYRSSKAAVNKVMQVLALDLAEDNIIVCPVHPGWVKTDMGGENADISVEESASGIVELARNLTMKQSGTFYTWDGRVHVW